MTEILLADGWCFSFLQWQLPCWKLKENSEQFNEKKASLHNPTAEISSA
jgi:hypothetical protein